MLLSMRPDGSGRTLLTRDGGTGPTFSSDGTRLTFRQEGKTFVEGPNIYVADARGHHKHFVARGFAPSWSADGRRILFIAYDRAIWSVRRDGTGRTKIRPRSPNPRHLFVQVVSSPDGSLLAVSYLNHGDEGIYVMRSDGTAARNITKDISGGGHFYAPTWSPDGSQIAFLRCLTVDCTQNEITTARPDGSEARAVKRFENDDSRYIVRREISNLTWSPDGQWFAFYDEGPIGETGGIYVMTTDGNSITKITDEPLGSYGFSWRPIR